MILCTDSIANLEERKAVIAEITDPKLNRRAKKLIDINFEEMGNMCGNMIMVNNKSEEPCVIMSERARLNLRHHNRIALERNYRIVASDLHMIETIGGGSARCMVAELF